ncbi:prolipoprotein diacylglyceryl transferase [Dechloromonas sp. XY25]|uniref:Prolipoprotein diacylglyceryl transferase n=1 Tax=Dechloromonas hankyongensis TaxID=2908002 RepID=A0ABS9JZ73_9RHOO|nr:prolipoprotein diacylglyceryl transferase family protein [Dechloromonas hankyongensis]MCG2576200.1 prolipoprotein diacylglyceryl transferase [Dechloromonas hankyongensis]
MSFIPAEQAALVHGIFEMLALVVGAAYYRLLRRRSGGGSILHGAGFVVAAGCVFGAAIGNKLVFWVEMPHLLAQYWTTPTVLFGGQSMVGGLLGGLIGVEIAKKLNGIAQSTGDAFVFPVLLGLMIGRAGCFLAGLADGTYGNPSGLPWAIDFGDGIPRHPTQLYEILFAGLLWWGLATARQRLALPPGLLFKLMLIAYLAWRLLVDAIKPIPYAYPFGLSGIQWVCLVGLVIYLPVVWRQWVSVLMRHTEKRAQ